MHAVWERLTIALLLGCVLALRHPILPGMTTVLAWWDRLAPSVPTRGALILYAEPPLSPDPSCPLLGALERGRTVQVHERRSDGWVAVIDVAEGLLWVPDQPWLPGVDQTVDLVLPLPAYAAPTSHAACQTGGRVRVVDAGEPVRVLRRGVDWSLVRVNGQTGWLRTKEIAVGMSP